MISYATTKHETEWDNGLGPGLYDNFSVVRWRLNRTNLLPNVGNHNVEEFPFPLNDNKLVCETDNDS